MSAAPAFPRVTIARIMGLVAVVGVGCALPWPLWVAYGLVVAAFATTTILFSVLGRHITLVELLVVIALTGVLIGLCLPAVAPHGRPLRRPATTAITPAASGMKTTPTGDEPSIESENAPSASLTPESQLD